MSGEILQAIGRLRRTQPRNPDTMAVCDALEVALRRAPIATPVAPVVPKGVVGCPVCEARRQANVLRVKRFRKRVKQS